MPQLPATVLYTPEELEVLLRAISNKTALPAAQELTMDQANRLVARWGGYWSENMTAPGAERIGIGLRRLFDITLGWRLGTKVT